MSIQEKLTSLSTQLSSWSLGDYVSLTRIVISTNEEGMPFVERKYDLWNSIPSFISSYYPASYIDENKKTLQFFYDIFGSRRIEHISKRFTLNLENKASIGEPLTSTDVEFIMLGIAEVRLVDVRDLLEEAALRPTQLRHLTEEETETFYTLIPEETDLFHLDKVAINTILDVLIPFKSVQEVFCGRFPKISAVGPCGSSLEGLRNRVFMLHHLRYSDFHSPCQWEYKVAKKLMNRDMPEGLIIPHLKGYYVAMKVLIRGGAFKVFLRSLGKMEILPSAIFYLGTQFKSFDAPGVLSKMGNFERGIGLSNYQSALEETRILLTDPRHGFAREEDGERFVGVGFSQGGALLQRDVLSFGSLFRSVVTVCSAGVEADGVLRFQEISESFSQFSKMEITHIKELKDIVPYSGDGHIGYGCHPEKVKIRHVTLIRGHIDYQIVQTYENPEEMTFTTAIGRVLESFLGDHCGDTTSDNYSYVVVENEDNREDLDALLLPDKDHPNRVYERLRRLRWRTQEVKENQGLGKTIVTTEATIKQSELTQLESSSGRN